VERKRDDTEELVVTKSVPRIEPISAELKEPLKSKMAKIFPADLPAPSLYRTVARNESLFIDMIDINEYEFNLHVQTISESMGLTKAQIADLKEEEVSDELWSNQEQALIHLIDGLVNGIEVSQPVFDEARRHFSEAELVELALLVGLYTGVAMIVALAKPELDSYRLPAVT
jgi:hypothetical protein